MATLAQKNRWPLEEARSIFGGHIHNNSPGCSQLILVSKQAGRFLDAIAPYVRLKAMEVYLARSARQLQEGNLLKGPTRDDATKIMHALRREIMRLNRLT